MLNIHIPKEVVDESFYLWRSTLIYIEGVYRFEIDLACLNAYNLVLCIAHPRMLCLAEQWTFCISVQALVHILFVGGGDEMHAQGQYCFLLAKTVYV